MMSMNHDQAGKKQLFQGSCGEQSIFLRNLQHDQKWDVIDKQSCDSDKSSSIGVASTNSDGSSISSSLDTSDDASSSYMSNSANSSGSLYDLSDLMSQLPIK